MYQSGVIRSHSGVFNWAHIFEPEQILLMATSFAYPACGKNVLGGVPQNDKIAVIGTCVRTVPTVRVLFVHAVNRMD